MLEMKQMIEIKKTTLLIYLIVIQELSKRKSTVKNTDISKILNVQLASVDETVGKLQSEGYLFEDRIALSKKGKRFIVKLKKSLI